VGKAQRTCCADGCDLLDKSSDTEFRAVATIKIGPDKARRIRKVMLSDLDPPNSYRISGEGEGGVAGFVKGGAKVSRRQGCHAIVMSKRRSAASSRSLDNASPTARRRRLPPIFEDFSAPLSRRR
jgi:hypothetical protein